MNSIYVCYGTETQNSKEVAQRIGKCISIYLKDVKVTVAGIHTISKKIILQQEYVIFVCSTTGQGNFPQNMIDFWKFLLNKNLPHSLQKEMKFAIFGLGDSSYRQYNHVARQLNARQIEQGANEIIEIGMGDDQHPQGYDGKLLSWIEELIQELLYIISSDTIASTIEVNIKEINNNSIYDIKKIITDIDKDFLVSAKSIDNIQPPELYIYNTNNCGKIQENYLLTENDKDKIVQPVIHVNINLQPENSLINRSIGINDTTNNTKNIVEYNIGDTIAIYVSNSKQIVNKILKQLNLNPYDVLYISLSSYTNVNIKLEYPEKIYAWELFTWYIDIQKTATRYFISVLYHFSTNIQEKEKLEEFLNDISGELLYHYCYRERRSYIEVLEDFPNSASSIPLSWIIESIPRILPRQYSIANDYLYTHSYIPLIISKLQDCTTINHVKEIRDIVYNGIDDTTASIFNIDTDISRTYLQAHICLVSVEYKTPYGRKKFGLCSNYIHKQCNNNNDKYIWYTIIKKNNIFFKYTNNMNFLLIGTGTGIAPQHSIIERRQYNFFTALLQNKDISDTIILEYILYIYKKKQFIKPYIEEVSTNNQYCKYISSSQYHTYKDTILHWDILSPNMGKIYLFYGCRYSNIDTQYQNFFYICTRIGIIDVYDVVLSRDIHKKENDYKDIQLQYLNKLSNAIIDDTTAINDNFSYICDKYVQDRQERKQLHEQIYTAQKANDTYCILSGRVNGQPNEMYRICIDILLKSGMEKHDAKRYLEQLLLCGNYIVDCWG